MNKDTFPGPGGRKPDDFLNACSVLEAQLKGESWFIEEVKSKLKEKDSAESFPSVFTKGAHDNVIHLAQFLFLLEALDCTEANQISAFIDSHNEKIRNEIDAIEKEGVKGRPKELKKAIFKPAKRMQVSLTFEFYQRPVFAISELGYLLSDLQSSRTTENLVNDLLYGGLMRLRGGEDEDIPLGTDPSRILVEPTEEFIDNYLHSLLITRSLIRPS